MQNTQNTNIEHIIAKIDNDFNIDHSDWIPRIAAWTIEALSILNCTIKETITKKIQVKDKIGYLRCPIDFNKITMYDENGCKIYNMEDNAKCGCIPYTGEQSKSYVGRDEQIAIPIDPSNPNGDYVTTSRRKTRESNRYFISLGRNKFELNFETEYVTISYEGVKTYYSETYHTDLPVIPNNALLLEAIGFYCMYKILLRGHKHPVMNLQASQYGTNPYYTWIQLKDEAKRSVIINAQGDVVNDGGEWRKAFYNFTFNPKD